MNRTHEGVSGYTISTGFRGLTGDQRIPGFWDVTSLFKRKETNRKKKLRKKETRVTHMFLWKKEVNIYVNLDNYL